MGRSSPVKLANSTELGKATRKITNEKVAVVLP